MLLLMVSGATDYLDGVIARRWNQVSRLGQLLDPLADRLYIFATLLGLGIRGIVPWWLLGLIVARDVVLGSGSWSVAAAASGPPPVHYLGKAATLNLLYAFPLLLLGDGTERGRDRGAGDRLGLRDLGHGAVLVGGRALPQPGPRRGRAGRAVAARRSAGGAGMKAVVMAGGEGTRLRPLTSSMPKPLLPVVNRPIMEHVLRLLRRHGMTDVVVTVQFLASLVRNYFGDGEELGMTLQYATEEAPLGTAGR